MSDNEELLAYIAAALGKDRKPAPKARKPRAAPVVDETINGVSIVDESAPMRRAPKPAPKPRARPAPDHSPEPVPASVRRAPEPAPKRAPVRPAPHHCNCPLCPLKKD